MPQAATKTWLRKINLKINLKFFLKNSSERSVIHDKVSINILSFFFFSSVQSLSHVRLFVTPWTAAHQASLSITNSQSLLKLVSIGSVMPSNHLILCHSLLLLPSIFPSIRVFSWVSSKWVRWPKYQSFSFSISPSNEYSGLISFRTDYSPRDSQESSPTPQFKSINSSTISYLYSPTSHPYTTTGKTIALTRWTLAEECSPRFMPFAQRVQSHLIQLLGYCCFTTVLLHCVCISLAPLF